MTRVRSRSYHAMSFGTRILLILLGATIGAALLPARADVVTVWNEKAIEILPKMGKQGPFNLRGLAMMHAAMFDAVNAIDHRFQSYGPDISAPADASREAAAIEAAPAVTVPAPPVATVPPGPPVRRAGPRRWRVVVWTPGRDERAR